MQLVLHRGGGQRILPVAQEDGFSVRDRSFAKPLRTRKVRCLLVLLSHCGIRPGYEALIVSDAIDCIFNNDDFPGRPLLLAGIDDHRSMNAALEIYVLRLQWRSVPLFFASGGKERLTAAVCEARLDKMTNLQICAATGASE